jgi:ADP-ribose pyrophosphatase
MTAKVNRSVILHEGRVFKLMKENITLDNGVTVDLDIIRHPGASAVVPITRRNTVLLLRQYRHAIGDFIWEIPAGTLSPHEAPLECARRELAEETGFAGNVWQEIGVITPVPGYSDERIHLFIATDLVPAKQNLDEDEVLHVHEVALDEAMEMMYAGIIQDSKTISGLSLANHWLTKSGSSGK